MTDAEDSSARGRRPAGMLQWQFLIGLVAACAGWRLAILVGGADPEKAANSVSSPGAGIAYVFTLGVDAFVGTCGTFVGLLLGVFVLAPLAYRYARKK